MRTRSSTTTGTLQPLADTEEEASVASMQPEPEPEPDPEPEPELAPQPRRSSWTWTSARRLAGWIAALAAAQALVTLDVHLPLVRPVLALGALVVLPTLLVHRKVAFRSDTETGAILYAFGTSMLALVVVGLLLNTALPRLGVERPLGPEVLGVSWFALDLALLLWRPDRNPGLPVRAGWRSAVRAPLESGQALAVLALVLAGAGAVRLDNGAGGAVAIAGHVTAAAALVAALRRSPDAPARDARVVGLVAAALLLATSLRGWGITGHDIQAEYVAFRLTDVHQHWSMDLLHNAYNACLSVTILPAVLAEATGLSGVVIFKVVLQLVFALVPVLSYLLARRFLPRRLALAAATFTIAFPTFFTDMPYLVRQEVAFFFLALLLLCATEPDRSARSRRLLVVVFGLGVVLAHYSTTYVMLIGLVGGLGALVALRLVRRTLRRGSAGSRPPLVLLHPLVVGLLLLAALGWAGPVTHTGGHAGDVARSAVAALLGRGTHGPGSSDLAYRLFPGHNATPRERLDRFVDDTLELRAQAPRRELLVRPLGPRELHPPILPRDTVPLTAAGRALAGSGIEPSALQTALRFGCAFVLQGFVLIGVAALLRSRRGRRRIDRAPSEELVCVVLGAIAAVGVVVVVPDLSVEYGVLRAFQQALLVIAPVMAWGMWTVARLAGRRAAALAAAVPVVILLVLSGALPSLVGGNPTRLALGNTGLYYDRYLMSDADVRAMAWVAATPAVRDPRPQVIASRNLTIPIMAAGDRPVWAVDRMFPTLLTTGSYVFVDSHLAQHRRSSVFASGDLITYRYPLRDLDRRLDLVYSAGRSRVYR